ncbi:MAG: metallophosphoesterase [bacterium]
MMRNQVLGSVFIMLAVVVGNCALASETTSQSGETLKPVTVAFIGDQGINNNSRAVLQLIKDEGADLVLHQGDLDYENNPAKWDTFITNVLGVDFPYLASVGNHDRFWHAANGYQEKLQARLDRIEEMSCSGDLGVQSVCTFRGLFFILSGIGTTIPKNDPDHVAYIRKQLAQTNSIWRICSWHKSQKRMQVGEKGNEVGWKPFKACRKGGAIVATGHTHSYSRTHLMSSFKKQSIASTANKLVIEEGRSFAFVSGLGGLSIRRQYRRNDPWWARVYTLDQKANFGALFCTYFVNSKPNQANCYFKDIDGNIPDKFELISKVKAHY